MRKDWDRARYALMCDDCGRVYVTNFPVWLLRFAQRWHRIRVGHRDTYGQLDSFRRLR